MSDSVKALRSDLETARQRAAASAEAVSYRTDAKARVKDAIDDGKQRVLAALAHTLDSMRDGVGRAATTAQSGAADLGERARPHVEAAGSQISEAAHVAAEALAPVVEGAAVAAETVAVAAQNVAHATSDAIEAGKEKLAQAETHPAAEVTGA